MQFLIQLKPTRLEMLSDGPTDVEAQAVDAHFHYLKELTEAGTVLMAGRTLVSDTGSLGLVVLQTDSEADAEQILKNDPAVSAGVMKANLLPYRVALWNKQGPTEP